MNATTTQKISGFLQNARTHMAMLQMTFAAYCAGGSAGRVLLHVLCACGDHQIRWHLQGIARELTAQIALMN